MFEFGPAEQLALFGGLLIAVSTTFNLLVNNRITGMSGIYSGFICFEKDFCYRAVFIFTMMLTTTVLYSTLNLREIWGFKVFDDSADLVAGLTLTGYFVAGLLVGLGTVLGNGCTSGHGVCGLPRFSLRSWVYVPVFVGVAIVTATLRSRVPVFIEENQYDQMLMKFPYEQKINEFLPSFKFPMPVDSLDEKMKLFSIVLGALVIVLSFLYVLLSGLHKIIEIITSMIVASVFAVGLIISGMNKRSKILGFLTLRPEWDPSLLIVLCGAVGLNVITFTIIRLIKNQKSASGRVDFRLIFGGVLFGLGWGLGGLCPGPGLVLFPFFTPQISFAWFGGLTIGQYVVKGYDYVVAALAKTVKVKSN